MGRYVTVADVRAEPEVPDGDPPTDAEVEARIAIAEDQIDEWLGPWQIADDVTGAKILEADVSAWQWTKLQRAVIRLAARLYAVPSLLEPATHESISGPDFSKSGPRPATAKLGDVTAPLNASGLRITGARARP